MKTAAFALVVSSALAQELPPFEEVDADSDGRISREEAAAVEGVIFPIVDADQNGDVSREEWTAAGGQ